MGKTKQVKYPCRTCGKPAMVGDECWYHFGLRVHGQERTDFLAKYDSKYRKGKE